jgi:hypothetical protein
VVGGMYVQYSTYSIVCTGKDIGSSSKLSGWCRELDGKSLSWSELCRALDLSRPVADCRRLILPALAVLPSLRQVLCVRSSDRKARLGPGFWDSGTSGKKGHSLPARFDGRVAYTIMNNEGLVA